MFKTLRSLGIAVALVALTSLSAFAQTTVTATTVAAAVGQGDSVVNLTSATGVSVGTELYSDNEAFLVTALNGTIASVQRGYDGTTPGAHAILEQVFAGGTGNSGPFVRSNPPAGTCAATSELFNLRINTRSGDIWRCLNSTWMTLNDPRDQTFKNFPGAGAAIASAAGVIAPISGLFHITGALAITGFTVPVGCATGCQFTVIPDGAFTTTNATNIAIASTAVVSKALTFTWEPVAAKWFPSY
jgi:hypothetical protein